jgi:hypothetical protein
MVTPDDLARRLLPLVREFCVGPYGIALGGSHAKECGDAHSDVDLYLFADRVLPGGERRRRVIDALGEASGAVSWGRDDPFVEGGTDFGHHGVRVECWLRSASHVERTIAACRRGEVRRDYVVWTVMGFFGHAALADVRSMRILEDAGGMLARWKAEVEAYPEPLRRALLGRFMREAAFWPGNFHYHTAIERADVIYTSGIVQQVAQALVQVAFALNREYFPGEKKLAGSLAALPLRPDAFPARLQSLLTIGKDPDVAALRGQRRELAALVAEMERLVAAQHPG